MRSMVPSELARVAGILVVMAGIAGLHYCIPDAMLQAHYLIQRLFYIPVVYAGLYFGWRAGLATGIGAGVAYLPQILATSRLHPSYSINQYAEVALFVIAGIVSGLLADRERRRKKILRETAEQLSRVYGELQDNFERMKRAERLYALGQLSAGLAHEIRNPLAGIEGAAAILLREKPTEERRVEFLQIIQKECRRLNRLVTSFLAFAKPRPPELGVVRVEQVFDSVIALAGHAIRGGGIHIRKEIEPDLTELNCDSEQLTQVLLNLTINAIQAMSEGGEIVLSAARQNGNAVIAVCDQGTGIAQADLEKIFDPFFTTKESGTGLGLPVAYQIAATQGGVLSVQHNLNKGMTFTLRLPLEEGGAAE